MSQRKKQPAINEFKRETFRGEAACFLAVIGVVMLSNVRRDEEEGKYFLSVGVNSRSESLCGRVKRRGLSGLHNYFYLKFLAENGV